MNKLKKAIIYLESLLMKLKKRKDILLMVHNELMFSYCILFYKLLTKDKRFRLWFCFDRPSLISKDKIKELKSNYGFKTISYPMAKYLRWDLALYPDHYGWLRKAVKKIYVSHGIEFLDRSLCPYSFDQKYTLDKENNLVYDQLFVTSELIKKRAALINGRLRASLRNVGSLMYDDLYALVKNQEGSNTKSPKKSIFIMSTWGNSSLLQSQGEILFDQMGILSEKYTIKFSIHPNNLIKEYSNDIDWTKKMKDAERKYGIEPILGPSGWKASFTQTDVIITDNTSLHFYFLLLNKPMILLNHKNGPFEPDADRLIVNAYLEDVNNIVKDYAYVVDSLSNIESKINYAMEYHDEARAKKALDKIVNYLGNSKQKAYSEICSILDIEEKEIS